MLHTLEGARPLHLPGVLGLGWFLCSPIVCLVCMYPGYGDRLQDRWLNGVCVFHVVEWYSVFLDI